jgi:hypothetical protein
MNLDLPVFGGANPTKRDVMVQDILIFLNSISHGSAMWSTTGNYTTYNIDTTS